MLRPQSPDTMDLKRMLALANPKPVLKESAPATAPVAETKQVAAIPTPPSMTRLNESPRTRGPVRARTQPLTVDRFKTIADYTTPVNVNLNESTVVPTPAPVLVEVLVEAPKMPVVGLLVETAKERMLRHALHGFMSTGPKATMPTTGSLHESLTTKVVERAEERAVSAGKLMMEQVNALTSTDTTVN